MKYLFFMIAFVTMLANLYITMQAVRLREKIKRTEAFGKKDVVTFYLPGRVKADPVGDAASHCADTVPLDMEV